MSPASGHRSSRPPAPEDVASPLADVVDALCTANEELLQGWPRERGRHVLPSRDAISGIVEDLRAVLFPGHFGSSDLSASGLRYYVGARLEKARAALAEQVRRGLSFACEHGVDDCAVCAGRAFDVVETFVSHLPAVRSLLESDVHAAYEGDPAAKFIDETLFCYPGVAAIIEHRIAHELYRLEVPLIPRIVAELSHSATGIDIHPGAEIGGSFFIDHGTGVVIGETCSVGERVRIYQGVTLGARGFASDDSGRLIKGELRHPIVEDDVVIYAGATILGRVTIGKGATIGGNVWLTHSVLPGARVTQAQARQETFQDGSGI